MENTEIPEELETPEQLENTEIPEDQDIPKDQDISEEPENKEAPEDLKALKELENIEIPEDIGMEEIIEDNWPESIRYHADSVYANPMSVTFQIDEPMTLSLVCKTRDGRLRLKLAGSEGSDSRVLSTRKILTVRTQLRLTGRENIRRFSMLNIMREVLRLCRLRNSDIIRTEGRKRE